MQLKPLKISALALAICAPMLAHAEFGIYAKGGTLGLGGGVGYGYNDLLTARVGYTTFSINHDVNTDDVDYKGKFKLGGAETMLDWHPFRSTFRVTGGFIFSRNKIDVDGKLNQTVTINNVNYTAGDLGDLSGNVKFKSTTPYLGIGWGNVAGKDGNFHFIADIGVQYLGSPKVKLNAACTAQGLATAPVQCAQLAQNVKVEEDKLNKEVEDYKFWPVITVGVGYRF